MAATSHSGTDARERREAIKAVAAGTIGTTIEWYDFYIYGLVAGLVFGKLFFPEFSALAGTLAAFSTFFVGFIARPLGAAIFGHFGDRIGRKRTLVVTLTLTAIGTVLVGVVPTYSSIGVWGAVILVVLRVIQGVGVGGEWSGSVLLTTEWGAFRGRRGFTGSWAQWGSPAGLVLATGVLALVSAWGDDFFLTWGWRIAFLASTVLFGVGLWIRLGILETPMFRRLLESGKKAPSLPIVEVLRSDWRNVGLGCLVRMGQHASFYLFTSFALSYGVTRLDLPRQAFLNAILIAGLVSLVTTLFWGYLSDVVGRKRMYLIGASTMLLFAVPYYVVLGTANMTLIAVFIVLSLVVHDMQYGPQAAFIAEGFPTHVRYSGSGLAYQLSSITSAGPAPLVGTYLAYTFNSALPVAFYLIGLCVIAIAASVFFRTSEDMEDYESQAPRPKVQPEVAG